MNFFNINTARSNVKVHSIPILTVALLLLCLHEAPSVDALSENVKQRVQRAADCSVEETAAVRPRDKIRTPEEKQKIRDCYVKRTKEKRLITKFYLVPRYNKGCTDVAKGVMQVRNFEIYKADTNLRYLEFPGCFDIDSVLTVDGNSPIVKSWKVGEAPNIFANLQWQFTNSKGEKVASDFEEDFDCQNVDKNGCGGYGNGCNYCDFCHEWEGRRSNHVETPITCPTGPGIQSLHRKNVCVDNWDRIDKDGAFGFADGEPDFFCYPENEPFVELAESLGDGAFGTMTLQITLATNNTEEFKLTKKYGTECRFKQWHQKRMETWRKTQTLACNVVVFDICKFKPVLIDGHIACGHGDDE